jgi:hypothetical protein
MNSKNFTIGVLSTTAVILLVGIMVIHSRPLPVMASGVTATSGDYVLTVGTFTRNDEELVYVIDAPQARMVVYRFNTAKGRIERADAIDLAEMRKATSGAAAQPGQQPQSGKRRGRRP